MTHGTIRVGVGGWTFEPWRGVFYPPTVKQKDELAYASRQLPVIEINGTYYGSQKPQTWAKWRSETPDGFVFTVKGSRFTTNRRVLAEAGESISRFFDQGILELGDRLGPVLWQMPHTKTFDPADVEAFLQLLPDKWQGHPIRHCIEARHDSFVDPAYIALLRKYKIGNVYADHGTYPEISDVTADFAYARLQTGSDDVATAYGDAGLDLWAGRLKTWAEGSHPEGLPRAGAAHAAAKAPREVFAFIIHEGKIRAPAGAQALIERVK
ncbi:MAG: putative conserved protein YecE [Verrucomicrobia bacterium]|nr:MAG: putative conserved protein YecE [Verrucomicrobiota bacterium]